MKQRAKQFESVSFRKDVLIGGHIQVAPGLWFACRELPSPWCQWWARVLLGWTFQEKRPV
jgi:hypothetical protein